MVCFGCKGKLKCGMPFCLVYKEMFKKVEKITDNFSGSSPPFVFIGSKMKYPQVNVGILSPPEKTEDAWLYDSEGYWAENDFTIQDIINLRSSLINSRFKSTVHSTNNKFLELSKEIGMATKPVDIEIELQKRVHIKLDIDKINTPQGARAPLKKLRITENPSIPFKIDKVVSDTDLKASEAIDYLHNNNFDEHTISKLLTIGVIGVKQNRRLVPTRWSITATHDILGKQLIDKIKDYKPIENHLMFFSKFMGNVYMILLFPDNFSYELFEMFLPRSSWNPGNEIRIGTDHESNFGRKTYASQTVGGYYATRLPILEYLQRIKRQAAALVFRFELPEYWAALGVWVVLHASRRTMNIEPIKFNSKEEILAQAEFLSKKKFNFDLSPLIQKSHLLKSLNQKKLFNYL